MDHATIFPFNQPHSSEHEDNHSKIFSASDIKK
jgi:hypothetical protein